MSEFWEAMGVTPIRPQPLSEDCGCCAGGIDGVGWLCPGCEAALVAGDRRAHPHELSAVQLALIEREGDQGGGIVEHVDALGVSQGGGPVTLVGILERDAREHPEGHPCRNCGSLYKEHPVEIDGGDGYCKEWR